MDAAELALLEASVTAALSAAASSPGGAPIDGALAELGWTEMLRAEPDDAVAVVFHALGTFNATATALDDVLAAALGLEPGSGDVAVLLPPFTSSEPPGCVRASTLHADGLASARASGATSFLVIAGTDTGTGTGTGTGRDLALATVAASAFEIRRVDGIDPAAGLHTLRLAATDTYDVHRAGLDPAAWETALAAGRRALAHQTHGACRAMLDLARTHARDRVQFDRPIARFQAVRHRLADALVAIEALAATLAAAADAGDPTTAALAKATAGRTARVVGAHCQQVLAGIGFTTEHPFHRFLKRTMMLDGLLGSADRITVEVGRRLLEDRTVPTLIDL
jgi:alkylation response protein AidB-like acyl-CoA dehydrogenase